MIDQNLKSFLVDLATAAAARIYTGNAPQNTPLPFVVLRRTSGNTPRTLSGAALNSRAQFSVDVLGANYTDVTAIANAIHEALDGFKGLIGTSRVMGARCVSEPADLSEIDGDQVYRRFNQEFLFVYSEG